MTASSAAQDVRDGMLTILPAAVAVIPFGLLLGALAAQKGLSPLEVGLMSGLVFAGSAQFVAVDIWREPAPWLLLGLTTLTINLRHVMMGASLSRHLGRFSFAQRLLSVFLLADEIWALAERRAAERELTPWFYAGLAGLLYVNFITWTVSGALMGALLKDPKAWGADFAFSAIFLGLIVGFWKGRQTGLIVAIAGLIAVLVERWAGGVWHILAGGLAGMILAAILAALKPTAEPAR